MDEHLIYNARLGKSTLSGSVRWLDYAFILDCIHIGRFKNRSEALREALLLLEEKLIAEDPRCRKAFEENEARVEQARRYFRRQHEAYMQFLKSKGYPVPDDEEEGEDD